ncbi:circularly permuted type 2 ATP-grasp protein [Acidisoma cellulosilytica]|uniref:Circularly permuted type 2 ATP-grasp protein n=1 Tax=Acidisoma cellulosilyticum TaxID=2802395 RepID=A0A964E2D3_9PROT|nr:circularly permuted type 2 ATP-grasp protein [Acidisoma cellulosilyticum]MCB8879301.1 circularly permuted type 2 ATP-grasp protein [Acidisoma cellulosilyticum]
MNLSGLREGVDEMVDGTRHVRPHWRAVLGGLSMLSDSLANRQRRLDQAFEDEGVRSILPGAPLDGANEGDGLWRCDPIPLPISAQEFMELEQGLSQRASLFEALLDDLYGRQTALAEGLLPPALVFNNPGFLRACHTQPTADHPKLNFYAADLIRGPDGQWRVLSDRTAGAAGAGMARENRRILSRVVPEMFRSVQIRPLRPFFDLWQDALVKAAPPGRLHPNVALLTPGPGSPQWLEHMLLSQELSCSLVEGGDLTIRGGIVYLKMLNGLHRIDVILRRMSGRMLDPLELNSGSLLGVPGLMDAVRAGTVRVVNHPGSGLTEAPAIPHFLPGLAQHFLGEPLRLPSVETVWLGDAAGRARVEADPTSWHFLPAVGGNVTLWRPQDMAPAERALLFKKIAAQPQDYAAMLAVSPSLAPCARGNELVPQPIVLRLFLVKNGGHWHAMPGGLARHMEPGQLTGQLPARGISKDVWVLAEGMENIVGPAAVPQTTLAVRRTFGELPSRTADNMFWLGRYIERLETAARLTRAIILRLGRNPPMPREHLELQLLDACLAAAHLTDPDHSSKGSPTAAAIVAMTRENGPIGRLLSQAGRLTGLVRDRLTGEMYAAFMHMLRAATDEIAESGGKLDGLAHAMASIQRFSTVVAGLAAENMVRGGSWIFLDMGRRVERAVLTADSLAIVLDQPEPRWELGLRLALEICDSAITYRSRYFTTLQAGPVLDLVIADDSNPRALAFQLATLNRLLHSIGDGGDDRVTAQAEALLQSTQDIVTDVLTAQENAASLAAVPDQLHALAEGIRGLSDLIFRRYFALLPMPRAVGVEQEDEAPLLRGAA